jgi:hypothetical protein
MASFKMGQCLVWLTDRAGEYKFAYISVLPLLSSVPNVHHFAFGVMASFKTYYEQGRDTWLSNGPGGVGVICMF